MAQRQVPGGPYVNEVGTAQRQVPGGPFVNETVSAGGGAFTLTADAGSYTLTGYDVSLKVARSLALDAGAYSLTGQSVGLAKGYALALDAGSYATTGQAVDLKVARKIALDAGSYSLTGNDPTLTYTPTGTSYSLALDAGSYTLTGYDVGLKVQRKLVVDAGAYSTTGYAADIRKGYLLTADAGAYSLSGNAITFPRTYALAADASGYTLAGHDVNLAYSNAPEPEVTERRRGAGNRFALARKRLPSAYLIDWLTNEEPSEETKRVIREIKAGRPLPERLDPPKVEKQITPEQLASKLIPRRLINLSEVLPVEQTQLIRKAVRIAQERDDEDILMLL